MFIHQYVYIYPHIDSVQSYVYLGAEGTQALLPPSRGRRGSSFPTQNPAAGAGLAAPGSVALPPPESEPCPPPVRCGAAPPARPPRNCTAAAGGSRGRGLRGRGQSGPGAAGQARGGDAGGGGRSRPAAGW